MKAGEIVTYAPRGPLGHVLAGCPGLVREIVKDVALVTFHGILEPVAMADLAPARLWWRKGLGVWRGPYLAWQACADDLRLCHGLDVPGPPDVRGAEIVSGGWRYRLAWGTDNEAPARYDTSGP